MTGPAFATLGSDPVITASPNPVAPGSTTTVTVSYDVDSTGAGYFISGSVTGGPATIGNFTLPGATLCDLTLTTWRCAPDGGGPNGIGTVVITFEVDTTGVAEGTALTVTATDSAISRGATYDITVSSATAPPTSAAPTTSAPATSPGASSAPTASTGAGGSGGDGSGADAAVPTAVPAGRDGSTPNGALPLALAVVAALAAGAYAMTRRAGQH
jgi:hypothetical protein